MSDGTVGHKIVMSVSIPSQFDLLDATHTASIFPTSSVPQHGIRSDQQEQVLQR